MASRQSCFAVRSVSKLVIAASITKLLTYVTTKTKKQQQQQQKKKKTICQIVLFMVSFDDIMGLSCNAQDWGGALCDNSISAC